MLFRSKNPRFPPCLHLPRTPGQEDRYIPLHYVNGLAFIATRFDMQDSSGRMLTRSNKYLVFHKKLGFMPMSALRLTKQCVTGLEALHEAHFPGADYSDPAVKMGKMHHVDMPDTSTGGASRSMECIYWDTIGPMRTASAQGETHATLFTCAFSGYTWAYNHKSTADIPALLMRFYSDCSPLRTRHGPILTVRRDNASVNVSRAVMGFLDQHGIRSETSNPYEPWQNGKVERMIQTVMGTARTVLLASGLDARFWGHALPYAVRIHNLQYSRALDTSPYMLVHQCKPDVSEDQQFGVEAWLYVHPERRRDPKFSARGEPCIFIGYPQNQRGFLVWCPQRGNNTVVSTTNVVFGTRCPRAKTPAVDLLPDAAKEVFLSQPQIGRAHV